VAYHPGIQVPVFPGALLQAVDIIGKKTVKGVSFGTVQMIAA